jgi:hypothetical protein
VNSSKHKIAKIHGECCLKAASEGGILTRDASLAKVDLTLSSFKLSWADLAAPFGSYKTETNFLPTSTDVSTSDQARLNKFWNFCGFCIKVLYTVILPIPKNEDVVSHPVRA